MNKDIFKNWIPLSDLFLYQEENVPFRVGLELVCVNGISVILKKAN